MRATARSPSVRTSISSSDGLASSRAFNSGAVICLTSAGWAVAVTMSRSIDAPMGKTHVALLKAVNVGGHGAVAMADLRRVLTEIGLTDVRTLLQSGNVLFG